MSHTNSTTNYGLPQFLTSDKPTWLTDVNNAFSVIDTAVYNAQTKADTAYTDAGNAQTDATTAINNAAAADAKGSGAIASIEANFDPTTIYSVGAKVMYNSLLYRCIVAVVTPGPWTGSANWERITIDSLISTTDSKIGSLSQLTTSDKSSLVGAVNEVDGKLAVISGSITPKTGYTVVNSSVKKIGNLVCVSFVIKATTAVTSRQTIATIDNGFRPARNEWYTFSGSSSVNGTSNRIITGLITSGGDIMVGDGIEPAGQNAIEFRGSCTYCMA